MIHVFWDEHTFNPVIFEKRGIWGPDQSPKLVGCATLRASVNQVLLALTLDCHQSQDSSRFLPCKTTVTGDQIGTHMNNDDRIYTEYPPIKDPIHL